MAGSDTSIPKVHSRSSNGTSLYEKACPECGRISIVDRRKLGKPCHPCAMEKRRTHGMSAGGKLHPLYALLKTIESRCRYPSATNYAYYGGRGIKVCREWTENPRRFSEWAAANGWRPGLEIDRIDPDGDYEPDNCRFITHRENSQRTRRIKTTPEQARMVRELIFNGSSIKLAAACAGVTYMVAWHIKNNLSVWSNV